MIKISEIKIYIRLNVSKGFKNKNRSGRGLQHILEKKATAVTKATAPLKDA
jgi:hypothetical protein